MVPSYDAIVKLWSWRARISGLPREIFSNSLSRGVFKYSVGQNLVISRGELADAGYARFSFCMRNLRPKTPRSLAGSLLVAHPNMLDPNFRRTVLYISAHDPDDGAIGIIINRPLDKSVADLVSETPPENLVDVPVFFGGPVGNNQLMLAAFEWEKGDKLKLNQHAITDALGKISGGGPSIFAFLGYAGWSAGQLEAEMKQKAWIVQKPKRSALRSERLSRLWFDIMNRLGPWYKMLAAAPDDPSLN